MITLHLFKASNPFQEIETRTFSHGEFSIGRDPSCDWCIPDDDRNLSRRHCLLLVEGERLFLRDISANGVSIGQEKRAAPHDERCELSPGEMLHLGEFLIVIEIDATNKPNQADVAPRRRVTDAGSPVSPPHPPAALTDAALLEAFCRGAGLEAASFAGADPASVMQRLGKTYRQAVDDLCSMMRDRSLLKDQYHLQRTTISGRDNNPLKWAPPHRVAIDLLQEDGAGFLKGSDAFKASFSDLRRHGVCLMSGSDAAIHFVLDHLHPDALEAAARRQSLPFASKYEAAWKLLREAHASLSGEAGDARIDYAFREGYERRLATIIDEEQAA